MADAPQKPVPAFETGALRSAAARRWVAWYRRALPNYWIFLFCMTHFPGLRLDGAPPQSDKVLHFGAFGTLAFLYWRFWETFGRPGRWFAWRSLVLLGGYAALDEYLQQFVQRGTDIEDWLANMVGISLALSFLEWRRRMAARPSRTARG